MGATRCMKTAVCAGLLLSMGSALAKGAAAQARAQPAQDDRAFLEQALGVNELELQLGRSAAERASSPEVKAMAQKMIQKHTELGQQLGALARQAGLPDSPEMSAAQRETLARVESQPAGSFDSMFKQTVDDGHVQELAMYRAEMGRAASPELRTLVEQRVAALQPATSGMGPRTQAAR